MECKLYLETSIQLFLASVILLGSPGPVPMALAATGISFGFKAGLGYLKGIVLGLAVVMIITAIALTLVVNASPMLVDVLKWISALYMVYVAYKIASLGSTLSDQKNCPSFTDGIVFNLINPKAYAAFLAINSQFTLPIAGELERFMTTGIICLIAGILVDIVWLAIGGYFKPILIEPKSIMRVRRIFASLLVFMVVISLLS